MVAVTSASPKAVVMAKQALLVLLVGGVCKFEPDYVSKVRVSSLWPYHWEMHGESLESNCRGSLCWF